MKTTSGCRGRNQSINRSLSHLGLGAFRNPATVYSFPIVSLALHRPSTQSSVNTFHPSRTNEQQQVRVASSSINPLSEAPILSRRLTTCPNTIHHEEPRVVHHCHHDWPASIPTPSNSFYKHLPRFHQHSRITHYLSNQPLLRWRRQSLLKASPPLPRKRWLTLSIGSRSFSSFRRLRGLRHHLVRVPRGIDENYPVD